MFRWVCIHGHWPDLLTTWFNENIYSMICHCQHCITADGFEAVFTLQRQVQAQWQSSRNQRNIFFVQCAFIHSLMMVFHLRFQLMIDANECFNNALNREEFVIYNSQTCVSPNMLPPVNQKSINATLECFVEHKLLMHTTGTINSVFCMR